MEQAVAYYIEQHAENAALGFIDALEKAYSQISHHPESGSPRHAHELNLPGIRSWPINGYPHVIFYVEQTGHIDVWRVLHGMSDIPAWLQGTQEEQVR